MPPRLCLGGRTPPSIQLLTSVNKAGDCRHEVKSCTPEVEKSKSPSGELLEKPFYNFKVINPITKSNWTLWKRQDIIKMEQILKMDLRSLSRN